MKSRVFYGLEIGAFLALLGCGLDDGRLDDDDLDWVVMDPQYTEERTNEGPKGPTADEIERNAGINDEKPPKPDNFEMSSEKRSWGAHFQNTPEGYKLATRREVLNALANGWFEGCSEVFWTATESTQTLEMSWVVGNGFDFEAIKTLEFPALFVAK